MNLFQKKYIIGLVISISLVFMSSCSVKIVSDNLSKSKELTLVKDGKAKAVIVLAEKPSPASLEGMKLLVDHIEMISGTILPVINEQDLLKDIRILDNGCIIAGASIMDDSQHSFILVGESEITKMLGISTENLGQGSILIKTTENSLTLIGPDDITPLDPMGTQYAVTSFMEEYLGIRYLWPGDLGKVVPKASTIKVPEIDITYTPKIVQRGIRTNSTAERQLKVGLEALGFDIDDYRDKITLRTDDWWQWHRLGGRMFVPSSEGHAFGRLWSIYSNDHPEWFAMDLSGSRDQSKNTQRSRLCKSNLELIKTIAQLKIEELNNNPTCNTVSLSPNDGSVNTFCMCDQCKALDPNNARKVMLWDNSTGNRVEFEYASLTDRIVYFWNAIVEEVTKVHPNALFTVDAYSVYSAPPVLRKLHPNLIVRFVGSIEYSNEEYRQTSLSDWDEWSKFASRLYWRPNLLHDQGYTGSVTNYVHKLAEDFNYLSKHGMQGTDFDSINNHWATVGLNYYILAKLMWNPDINIDEVVDDYFRSGFGNAAKYVKQYFLRIEELAEREAAKCIPGSILANPPLVSHFTSEEIDELGAMLNKAMEAAQSDSDSETIIKRIKFVRIGYDFSVLQAEIYKLLAKAKAGENVDLDNAKGLLAQKYEMMIDIFKNHPLAVNVAYVGYGERGERFSSLGWSGIEPPDMPEADEQGRPIDPKP
ncbi:MAG TPA: DUF4838 domain-containing protein [Clostridiales bacterium]|nr:DUF4838 domain-containing protein [Clostridiales bacterium]